MHRGQGDGRLRSGANRREAEETAFCYTLELIGNSVDFHASRQGQRIYDNNQHLPYVLCHAGFIGVLRLIPIKSII